MIRMKRITKKIGMVLLAIFVVCCFPNAIHAKKSKTLRVAYPTLEGFSMKDSDGNYYGYDYDYLMQVSQYTGWDYEFVEVEGDINEQLTKLMDMLKKGEIDLMGGTVYMDSLTSSYDYASEPYGNGYSIIATRNESEIYDLDTLMHKKDLKIAVYKTAKQRVALLDQFMKINGISYKKVECKDEEELLGKVNSGEVDAFLSVDLSLEEGCRSVAKFSPTPFYFITTKGNSEVMSELNVALNKIAESNPMLQSTLHDQYFQGSANDFLLTPSEEEFIKQNKTLRVLYRDGNAPVQYVADGEAHGVGKDILDMVAKKTGLKFEYFIASTYDEYKKIIEEEGIDILLGVPYDAQTANQLDVNLTNPFLKSSLLLVTNNKISPTDLLEKKQAMSYFNQKAYDHNDNITYYNSAEEIMKAVDSGKQDYAYLNNYLVTYYDNKHNLKNISTFTVPDYLQSYYAYGISKTDNLLLVSIMNKAIRSSDYVIDNYIYKNAYIEQKFSLIEYAQEHFLWILLMIAIVLIIVIQLIRKYYNDQLKIKRQVELEYKRYQMLSEISGEMIFSYDYQQDELKISNSGIGKLADEELLENFSLHIHDSDQDIRQILHKYLQLKKDINEEIELELLDKQNHWYQITLKVIYDVVGDQSKALYAIGKIIDIQDEIMEREQLRKRSQSDPLTHVLNRAGAEEIINNALHEHSGLGALLMIDLDNFKDINDQFGHSAGDDVLVETADLLKKVFAEEVVARFGGDEFIIFIHETSIDDLRSRCELLLTEIGKIPCMKGRELHLTMSIGVVFVSDEPDMATLLEKADDALYKVKRNKRNNYCIFTKE